jgi:hypothetical protein
LRRITAKPPTQRLDRVFFLNYERLPADIVSEGRRRKTQSTSR